MNAIDLKKLKTVLNFVKKSSRPILQKALVTEKGLMVSDIDTNILIKNNFDLKEGLYELDTLGLVKYPLDLDKNEFPLLPIIPDYKLINHAPLDIDLKTIDRFLKFTSKDPTRLHLNAVALTVNGLVATDGHRMIFKEGEYNLENSILIPSDSLKKLIKVAKKFKITEFKIFFDNDWAYVENEYFAVSMRLIQREFPRWQAVIPSKTRMEFTINKWIDFKTIKPLLDKKNPKARIFSSEGELFLEIINPEVNHDELFSIGHSNDEINFGINVKYLDELIGKNKELTFRYNNELSPIISSIENEFKAIVMPVKL